MMNMQNDNNVHFEEIVKIMEQQLSSHHNQFNAIAGFIQLKKYDEALECINKYAIKNRKVHGLWQIKNWKTVVLLYSKCAIEETRGISVEIDIRSSLEFLNIDWDDFNIVLSSLIDTSIQQLEQGNVENRILYIDITETEEEHVVSIGHSYQIAPSLYEEIFREGNNEEYGLSNINEIILRNRSKIIVESYDGVGTVFTVFLPRKK